MTDADVEERIQLRICELKMLAVFTTAAMKFHRLPPSLVELPLARRPPPPPRWPGATGSRRDELP
jgi:hypothetical protein